MQQREATPKAPALDTKINPAGPSDDLRKATERAEQAAADSAAATAEAADKAHWDKVRQEAQRKQSQRVAPAPRRQSFCGC